MDMSVFILSSVFFCHTHVCTFFSFKMSEFTLMTHAVDRLVDLLGEIHYSMQRFGSLIDQ